MTTNNEYSDKLIDNMIRKKWKKLSYRFIFPNFRRCGTHIKVFQT